MHFPRNETDFLIQFKDQFTSLQNSSAATVEIANIMFPDLKFRIVENYVEESRTYFKAEVQKLDYSEPSSSAKQINHFVENATNLRIKDIISEHDLKPNTALVLANTLYFKSAWNYKFDTTRMTPFHLITNVQTNVSMMYNLGYFPWAEIDELDAQVVALPYVDRRYNMLIILPNAKDGIIALEDKIKTINLESLHNKLELRFAHVFLPKFKVQSEIKADVLFKEVSIFKLR